MGRLTPDQEKQLAELTALREAPDTDDDYEVAIEADGRTVRVPWSRVPKGLRDVFGLTEPEPEPQGDGDGKQGDGDQGDGDGKQGDGGQGKQDPGPRAPNRYFR